MGKICVIFLLLYFRTTQIKSVCHVSLHSNEYQKEMIKFHKRLAERMQKPSLAVRSDCSGEPQTR